MAKQRAKAGTSKAAAHDRRQAFVAAYIANGRNATRAAITAGYSPKTATVKASQLLRDVNIAQQVAVVSERAAAIAGLTVERTLQEIARVAYQDPRRLYDAKGNLKPVHEMDDDAAATISSVEVTEEFEGHGKDRESVGFTKKIKLWDKNSALVTAARHLGLFEKDNKQRVPIQVDIELVG